MQGLLLQSISSLPQLWNTPDPKLDGVLAFATTRGLISGSIFLYQSYGQEIKAGIEKRLFSVIQKGGVRIGKQE